MHQNKRKQLKVYDVIDSKIFVAKRHFKLSFIAVVDGVFDSAPDIISAIGTGQCTPLEAYIMNSSITPVTQLLTTYEIVDQQFSEPQIYEILEGNNASHLIVLEQID